MSISMPGIGAAASSSVNSAFDNHLTIAKSSKVIADFMASTGRSAISKQDLQNFAGNSSGNVPSDVSAAASYLLKHEDAFTAIETHDVPQKDDYSGVWNFEWAADGGLDGTAIDAIAKMEDAFDRAIEKSSEITEKTTIAKTELDASKQRPQN
ncbi:hypothetical protein [Paracoccus onubensis]|uniref:Uncharacterized protein n=1 Tax=Paracoccus onubensis TaxID=1675788 RepID=A0A418T8H6_9RHOB|nr:hypothetical protein [Paracoccus onubensis]RJE89477.1 hypothetical protein D3P04_02300 [Paracoccus onubensis]